MRILFFGLPGAGKTFLADEVAKQLKAGRWFERLLNGPVVRLNADKIREEANDWDFSPDGRLRQAKRIRSSADAWLAREFTPASHVIADFVAPLPEYRKIFAGDFVVYMDTISRGRYADTNALFVEPTPDEYHLRITHHRDVTLEAAEVCRLIAAHRRG